MTLHITDTEIIIKRSDLPSMKTEPYPEHDLEDGVVSLSIEGHELFHNAKDGYEQWVPEQETYILQSLAVLLIAYEVDAQLGVKMAGRLLQDIEEFGEHEGALDIAAGLIAKGWVKK